MTTKTRVTGAQPILCTNDIERLKSFYAELLGATEHLRVPDHGEAFYVMLRLGPVELGLVDAKAADAEPGHSALAVFVDSVDDLLPHVEPAGGKVLGPANDMAWGHRVAHVTDPDGNQINLTQQL